MSKTYLEGVVGVGTFAGPERADKGDRRCVQITTRAGYIQLPLDELPAVLEALGRVAVENFAVLPPASAPAHELEEILLVERLIFQTDFSNRGPFIDPESGRAHYFVELVVEGAKSLARRDTWPMLAPKYAEAIAFKIILVRKKKELPRG